MSFLGANIFFHSSRLKHLAKGNGNVFGLRVIYTSSSLGFHLLINPTLEDAMGVCMHLMLFVCLFVVEGGEGGGG
jgi:hypothetical protein